MLDDPIQDVVRESTGCQSVMLGRLDNMVPDHKFEFLFDGVGDLGEKPDVSFQ